jgi:hypothetical protein
MDFNTQLAGFIAGVEKMINDDYVKSYPNLPYTVSISAEWGQKFVRIVRKDIHKSNNAPTGQGGSVYCFIQIDNGDILKAAGWKAPAKHARGNIMQPSFGVDQVGPYGPAYLK